MNSNLKPEARLAYRGRGRPQEGGNKSGGAGDEGDNDDKAKMY